MNPGHPPMDVCITGIGMVSALGLDCRTSCAAARATVSRARELDYFRIKSIDDGEVGSVKGHALPGLTEGFEGLPRYLAIARGALTDLVATAAHPPSVGERTGVYMAAPDLSRIHSGIDLVVDEAVREERIRQSKRHAPASAAETNRQWRAFVDRLFDLAGVAKPAVTKVFDTFGHCGAATAIGQAVSDLQQETVDAAVVGGIDSLLEEETLQWLLDTGRLKTDDTAAGLMPGEAGAFIRLERVHRRDRPEGTILGRITGLEHTREKDCLLSGAMASGKGTLQLMKTTLHNSAGKPLPPYWLIIDQNGEVFRANDWGHALVHLTRAIPDIENRRTWYPALAFGDTATASGFMAVGMALRAFRRGYAVADTAIIVSASDGEDRTALLVSKP